jgi:transcriptional regulator with XRE-family HTH domain
MRRASAIRQLDVPRTNVIGERLRVARQLHRPPLSMEETGRRATELTGYRITRDMLVKIENDRRSVYDYEVRALALALDVDARFLLGLVDDPGPRPDSDSSTG